MKKTILVVDDFQSIREFICDTLKRKGYEILDAANGNDALKVLEENIDRVGLVLSDYNMPGYNGLELLKKIKSQDNIAATPVIFLTTESDPAKMKSAKEAGLSAWIRKPYKTETFFAQIENVLKNG